MLTIYRALSSVDMLNEGRWKGFTNMSGHSKWSTIRHKKAAIDAKRGKIFTKLVKEITVAARQGGGELDSNPRLRTAIDAAKAQNMPADNIDRAVKKGTGELEGVEYVELTYEGYGPEGVAILIDVLTDNKNRTQPEIRLIFNKKNGSIGEPGSVGWMFDAKGLLLIPQSAGDEDVLMDIVLEAGAEDFKLEDGYYEVLTAVADFESVKSALRDKSIEWEHADLTKLPQNKIEISDLAKAKAIAQLIDALEDHDDVQKVYSNVEFDEAILSELDI